MAASAAAAPIPQPIPLNTANWSGSAGFGSTAPGWYEDSFGIVHLQGAAKQISTRPPLEIVLGTLPAAARPTRDVFTIVHTFSGTYADLEIETNGTIAVIGPAAPAVEDLSFVSLEGDHLPAGERASRECDRAQRRQLVGEHRVRFRCPGSGRLYGWADRASGGCREADLGGWAERWRAGHGSGR
jgi:hypothetical protein